MKTIIITRHAKSSWDNILQKDFDRTLNSRGYHDAPMMGKRLENRNLSISKIISSAAIRAKETALLIANELQYASENILFLEELYHAPPNRINDVIIALDDNIETAMIVCHNPGITDWVNEQAGTIIANMPTCAMAAFTANVQHWHQFAIAKKELFFLDFPKNGIGD